MALKLVPATLTAAREFVGRHHRHHSPPVGGLFAVGVSDVEDGSLGDYAGLAIVGRPVARHLDDGVSCEVTRCCTDGSRNACSMLYGACARAARALGYRRIVTYTLAEESGASLRGAGWRRDGVVEYKSWDSPSRPRTEYDEDLFGRKRKYPTGDRVRWILEF